MSDPHPLYPEQDTKAGKIRYRRIYEPKECGRCGTLNDDVYLREVYSSDYTFSNGSTITTKYVRLCNKCYNVTSHPEVIP